MSNGTTNVDQANFHMMSANRGKDGFEVVVGAEFPSNIDPEALREEFDREGAVSIKLNGKWPKEKETAEEKGFELGE